MSLKYSFSLAFIVSCALLMAQLLGLVDAGQTEWPALLLGLVVVAAAGAWFVDLLDRRLSSLQQAVQRLAEGDSSLAPTPCTRVMDGLDKPFERMVSVVNQRFAELESSVAQHRAIAEHGPDAMFVFHVESFLLIDVNDNFERLSGYARSDVVGRTPMEVSTPIQCGEPVERYAGKLIERALAGDKIEAPWTILHRDGREVPCELRAVHLSAPGKTLICGSLVDISARLATEAELRHRMRFESLVTRLSTTFISLPVEDTEQAINDALAEIGAHAGVDRSYLFEFSEDRRRVSCTAEWCATGIEPHIARLQSLAADDFPWVTQRLIAGQAVHVPRVAALPPEAAAEQAEWQAESIQSLVLVPMHSGSEVVGYVGFDAVTREMSWSGESLTLLKIFGEMLSNLLARKRAELILQIRSERLAEANTTLQRRNAELQQFAYIASHDLQEPLRAIGGFASLLSRRYHGRLDKDADEFLDFITGAATRMQRMIVDLLDYSRLGREPKPFAPCALADSLQATRQHLRSMIDETGAVIESGELPVVMGDPELLARLFQNLIGNAIKFRGSALPQVRLQARRADTEWIVSVSDNGIGIPAEQAQDVFQIFRRVHTRDEHAGTGIGLAVCQRIVELHRGRIWVEANPGGGSRFSFALPVHAQGAATSMEAIAVEA